MTRTCSQCTHHVTPSAHFEGSKRCELKHVYYDVRATACPSFNAPSGLRWHGGYTILQENGHEVIRQACWVPSVHGEQLSQWVAAAGRDWELVDASRPGPAKILLRGTLHGCARALVERVKERKNG